MFKFVCTCPGMSRQPPKVVLYEKQIYLPLEKHSNKDPALQNFWGILDEAWATTEEGEEQGEEADPEDDPVIDPNNGQLALEDGSVDGPCHTTKEDDGPPLSYYSVEYLSDDELDDGPQEIDDPYVKVSPLKIPDQKNPEALSLEMSGAMSGATEPTAASLAAEDSSADRKAEILAKVESLRRGSK